MSFVSFVVKDVLEPEPSAIWLQRFNHEEHEGARRWLVFLSVSSVSFVLKSCLEPEPGTIWLKKINHEEHEGARRWLVFLSVSFVSFVVKDVLEPSRVRSGSRDSTTKSTKEHEGGWSSSPCPPCPSC